MKASIGTMTKTSTLTSPKLYGIAFRGGIVEIRLTTTKLRKRVCKLTLGGKVFKQTFYIGGETLLLTTRNKIYKYLGIFLGPTGDLFEFTSIQSNKINTAKEGQL